MKHDHAELIGMPVAPEKVEKLNSLLKNKGKEDMEVILIHAILIGDREKGYSINMEILLKGHEFTPCGVSANGRENHVDTDHLTNDKGTSKLFETYEARKALNQFFIDEIVPLFC